MRSGIMRLRCEGRTAGPANHEQGKEEDRHSHITSFSGFLPADRSSKIFDQLSEFNFSVVRSATDIGVSAAGAFKTAVLASGRVLPGVVF